MKKSPFIIEMTSLASITYKTTVLIGLIMMAHITYSQDAKQKVDAMHKVTSSDGTQIACSKTGKGPAIILVNGALATHSSHKELAELLAPHFTVYNFDRRGRGNSGDNKRYTVEAEIEDIEALIDEAGGSAYLHGISSGACLALEAAAALGGKVKKLSLYEAPYDDAEGALEKWKDYKEKYKKLIAENRHNDAIETHLKFTGAPNEMITEMKASPAWSGFEAMAATLAYDIAALGNNRSVPEEKAAKIKAPTLVMDGAASKEIMPFMSLTAGKLAKAFPNAQRKTIEGQGHNPSLKVLAPILIAFFNKN